MNDKKYDTVSQLFKLMYIAMDYEHAKRTYGTNIPISNSEIYLLKCIADNPDCNVTLLANLLHVSKAAISQLLKKVGQKELVDISRDADNYSRYIINLSAKGKQAHKGHMKLREHIFNKMTASLDGYDDDMLDDMYQFLKNAGSTLSETV